MRFVDEFRDPEIAKGLAERIAQMCDSGTSYKFMEVCGGHTHTIYKHGIEDYLPPNITLVHGPGCPVCVIPTGRVDDAIHIAEQSDVILTTFGDMMRVPGGHGSFLDANARGADIRMVYSPLDALKIARQNPAKRVVFMAIGFETTAPSTAVTLLRAVNERIENFSIFCNHVTILPALKAILDSPDLRLDGFIGPGHVSTVIGCRPYEFITRDYQKPVVVGGFEPLDLLQSIFMQLYGRKRITLFSPEQAHLLYPHHTHRGAIHSAINAFEPDLERHPLLRHAVAAQGEFGPGDVFYIPPSWWHLVQAVELSITATLFVGTY